MVGGGGGGGGGGDRSIRGAPNREMKTNNKHEGGTTKHERLTPYRTGGGLLT